MSATHGWSMTGDVEDSSCQSETLLNFFHGSCETAANGRSEPEGIHPRTLLRPCLRLRHHAGLPPPARAPDVGGRRGGADRTARRVVVVELYDLDHKRTGYGDHPGSPAPPVSDARQPPDVCSDPGCLRRARATVRGFLRGDPGGTARVSHVRGGAARDDRAGARWKDPHVVRSGGGAVDRGRVRGRADANGAVASCARARLRRAARPVLGPWTATTSGRHVGRWD